MLENDKQCGLGL